MAMFEKIVKYITGIASIVSHVGFLFIMFLTVCDIGMRWITGGSILGAYEIVERSMICAVFASFAYTQTEHGHVQITLLIEKYPKVVRFILMFLSNLISAAASVMVAYAAYGQGQTALASHYTTGVLLIPTYPFYWVEIVAMFALTLAFVLEAIKNLVAIFNAEVAKDVLSY